MNELQTMLSDTANRLFTDHLQKPVREAAEEGQWPQLLWQAVEENGFGHVLVSEARGGAGAGWSDAMVLLRACGTHAVPLPLAETIVAAWLLDQAGLDVPEGPLTFAQSDLQLDGDSVVCTAPLQAVPFAAQCKHVVAVSPHKDGVRIALFVDGKSSNEVTTIARDPVADLTYNAPAVSHGIAQLPADAVLQFGAVVRAAGIAGALQAVLLQAVQYAGDRVQFGRPISQFQAVQHQLAELASHAASVGVAVDAAARAIEANPMTAGFDIAVAKVRAADAAQIGASIAHQTHGAIGFTYEHGLHFWTRRLWSWAPEFGGAAHWAQRLGKEAIKGGGKELWTTIAAR